MGAGPVTPSLKERPSDRGSVQHVSGSASSVVTNSFAVPVRALGPARLVRNLAGRVIGQIADGFGVSVGDQAAFRLIGNERAESAGELALTTSSFGRESISLPKPRESAAKSEVLRGGEPKPEPIDLQALLTAPADFAHNSGR